MTSTLASCIFCKIIKGEIPCFKLFESDKTLAFLDINPLSRGHALVIPKHHGAKLADIPDEHLSEILVCLTSQFFGSPCHQPVVKKLVAASGAEDYNVLQNNGRIAHQMVDHIPKPNEAEGLGVGWPQQATDMDKLKALFEDLKSKM
ncbi:Hit family protein 1 [Colletotrichum gloeosporioides]|uniref:Hit family protein 1 n=1 Tax=Colletotrichum gloeosporioides TaxID=474922 RepID=A0A8H4CC21_COLGL|nr:Hit family protein 1 [Colletotrichum gloeosporioides]KAF3801074.1 Hit family protein 1 [Colletotrichum gloeosporioides]